ncbi:MAG TPA: radical SAM protein [Thermoanaerobaculia bacterium]|nr:radical SAM protein [Thermoanaerobaculia bacterium]
MSVYPSAPRVANAHLFRAGGRPMLLSVSRGQIFELDEMLADDVDRAMQYGDEDRVRRFLGASGIFETPVSGVPPTSVPLRGISLAIAQKCNLGCTYCYAQQGTFGGVASTMPLDVARSAIDRLFDDAAPGETVSVTFLGGEPLTAREFLRAATEYAAGKARAAGANAAFALTTNATLLTDADAEFFERYAFAVTVSVDGIGETHDRQRPFKSGAGSYARVIDGANLLLRRSPRRSRITARVTVTPRNLRLRETLDELTRLGFDGVLFSPVLGSPTGEDQMSAGDFDSLLSQLIDCAEVFEERLRRGEIHPFLNVINTLRRIHRQERDAYPCGAGGGYLGVSAKGRFYACHRFVDEELGVMGNVEDGVDPAKQQRWLADRNVHAQEPCRTCWARYLCSGGCHHEVIHRGRPACDYIRGWLHHCLGVYARLLAERVPSLREVLDGA